MHTIELPHDDLLVSPSEVWNNLSPEHREPVVWLLTKLAYALITTQRGESISEADNELPASDT